MFKQNDFNQIFPKIYKNQTPEISGIDTDLITSEDSRFSEQFNCKLCIANIPLIPFQCKTCNNIFCKNCCLNLKECPLRCGSSIFIPLSIQLKNVLELIKFKCINVKNGCNQILEYRNFINHVNNECKFFPNFQCLICKNFKGNFNECKRHFEMCGNIEKKCNFCMMNIKNYLINEHEKKCKTKEIFCEFCKKKLIRKNYFEHINNFCIERIKKCDLCKISYKFKDKDKFHTKEICYKKQIEILNKKNLEQAKTIVDFIINKNKNNNNDVCNFCSLLEMNYQTILNDKNKEIENLKIEKENFQNILINQEKEIKSLKLKIEENKKIINKKNDQSNNNNNNIINNIIINENNNNHNNINNYNDINFIKKNKFNNESNYFLFSQNKNNNNPNNNNLNNNQNKIKNNNSIDNKKNNKKYNLYFNNELTPNNIIDNENNNSLKRTNTESNKKNKEENNEKDENCKIF